MWIVVFWLRCSKVGADLQLQPDQPINLGLNSMIVLVTGQQPAIGWVHPLGIEVQIYQDRSHRTTARMPSNNVTGCQDNSSQRRCDDLGGCGPIPSNIISLLAASGGLLVCSHNTFVAVLGMRLAVVHQASMMVHRVKQDVSHDTTH